MSSHRYQMLPPGEGHTEERKGEGNMSRGEERRGNMSRGEERGGNMSMGEERGGTQREERGRDTLRRGGGGAH